MRNLIGLVTALITTAISLAACGDDRPPCKHFEVGQKVRVIAYPTEHYVVVGTGFACVVAVWRPGSKGELPAELLEIDPI